MFHAEVLEVYHQRHLVNKMTKLKVKVKESLEDNTTQRKTHCCKTQQKGTLLDDDTRHITGGNNTKAHYQRK